MKKHRKLHENLPQNITKIAKHGAFVKHEIDKDIIETIYVNPKFVVNTSKLYLLREKKTTDNATHTKSMMQNRSMDHDT